MIPTTIARKPQPQPTASQHQHHYRQLHATTCHYMPLHATTGHYHEPAQSYQLEVNRQAIGIEWAGT